MFKPKRYVVPILIFLIIFLGIFLRFYKIDFGLPHSFLADETDIYDETIRYAMNYKFIKDLEGFSPGSYVYGMFPTYFLTFSTMVLNKIISIFNSSINFDFYFVYMRIITSSFSLLAILFTYLIYKNVFKDKDKYGSIAVLFLTTLNWKLISHSHYLNHDTYLMVLSLISSFFLLSYFNSDKAGKKWVSLILSSIFLGIAVGTKVTALITLPIILICIGLKKDIKGLFLYTVGTVLAFCISNPFSVINFSSFYSRLILMKSVEAGVVFNSVNTNPLKYLFSLSYLVTLPILIFSLIGIYLISKETVSKPRYENIKKNIHHIFLIGSVLTYVLFFSLNPRLIDRWMLPILPILIIYSVKGISFVLDKIKGREVLKTICLFLIILYYLLFSFSIFNQLRIGVPRVNAYLWAKEYFKLDENINKKILMYSNKPYKDPFKNIDGCEVDGFNVYESRGAGTSYPKNPYNYDYLILYSTMSKSYKNKYVMTKYPEYSRLWIEFEDLVTNSTDFTLVKEFKTTKLNLMDIAGISIYKKQQ